MRVRTPADFGALIRERRRGAGLDQATLAERVGVSRQWIVAVERGKATAPIGLVLRTLAALGVELTTAEAKTTAPRGPSGGTVVKTADIDEIIRRGKGRR